MPDHSPLIQSLRTAVAGAPDDVPLRLHLAELLIAGGHHDEAVAEAAVALQHAPGDPQARELMARAMGVPPQAPEVSAQAPEVSAQVPEGPPSPAGFNWKAAEDQVGDVVPPRFVETPKAAEAPQTADGAGDPGDASAWEVEAPHGVRLADVGGMQDVKDRLEAAFLAPLRNPELRKLYGKSLRGGLLLYGPPGCGKTFIARAVAGELGANFLSISINDVLDMWMGNSERNMHEVFETARRQAPCVLFLDELDALGAKRSRTAHSGMRNTVNQLLTELDGIDAGANEGVFVLAATNVPWDVDNALRRPGRLDRTILVLPPDAPAREAILRYHLRDRPIANIDLRKLTKATDGLSGADLAHLCEAAAERALLDSARTGTVRMIGMQDLTEAAATISPSSDPWFASARNVAMFANEGGMYDDLVTYLKKKRKL
ncbi:MULTISPECIES: tetratricopeptide repeat protein [Streptomyces]|uniref:AAA family ATPase n=1 Tax=Streptomyces venezuelae TaxID=54571 RepID=A0A5P2BHX7_STRVZ|nr:MULTISPECIES: tetratricopeptide repeat protein [Streptomyces]NEA01761.1 tetratricopeptide repeat protein [Streptomyces sp. SID10116]MYY82188.1 tetratricopeptide repeat protein [Streptomyces sp. SID335]MYZ12639.1 tetratricopeptide repeat protein [Streptomyces sp. SID337]NDZ90751.1 tetratricopeptide repeat protein [Streptomyces sp. SID10115]NEB46669.1 tetratricopeptide repeat protein [Streptomyces sp. SID339]